ncbi:hypothetical protein BT96DRAFT_971859 [Gymnopus androsaceus JB14]|uniref:Uncharacterized protein n=1 Tax=Gymnopus androsaceus JB14 TaxID=1447944 RepID=A0A6A4I9D7_9AGAR|nr:hypothetical protein BT96DRAFT_971859 [Gymnopus androsaceus JB14]
MQEAKEMLVLADKDLEYYESETIRLRSQTDHVEAQKNYILDCRIKLRWILSRFRQLPNELLLLIFEFACEWNLLQEHPWLDNIPPSTKIGSSPLSHLPALAITAVCTRWRTLALSSPILWSKIKLELSLQAANNSGFTSILKLYLERSANSPLFLFLDAVGKPRMGKKTDLLPLAQCVHRWSSFTYRGHYAPSRAIPFTSRHFGSLEDLDIELHNNVTGGSAILDLFRIAPKLRSLTTDLTPNCLIDSAHRENELAVLLNSCPNLNTVKLRQQDGLQFKVDFPPHKYHTIHSLTLAVGDHKMARDFMKVVFKSHAFPSLNELHLQTRDEYIFVESAWPKDAFHGFMSRSLCTITSFSVHGLGISDSDFIDILHLLPSLLELSLDDHWLQLQSSPKIALSFVELM